LHLYLTSKNILRAFDKNKYHYGFDPDLERVTDTVSLYFFLQGVHLEKVMKWSFPKNADMKASGGVFYPLEAFLISHFINHQKGGLKS
jgi:hypothetical protein